MSLELSKMHLIDLEEYYNSFFDICFEVAHLKHSLELSKQKKSTDFFIKEQKLMMEEETKKKLLKEKQDNQKKSRNQLDPNLEPAQFQRRKDKRSNTLVVQKQNDFTKAKMPYYNNFQDLVKDLKHWHSKENNPIGSYSSLLRINLDNKKSFGRSSTGKKGKFKNF